MALICKCFTIFSLFHICYGFDLGQFPILGTNTSDTVYLYLYTPDKKIAIDKTNYFVTLKSDKPTFFICHGFGGNSDGPMVQMIAERYYAKYPERNIILVDYEGIGKLGYLQASKIVEMAGKSFCDKMIEMLEVNVLNLQTTHIYGFSLAAHIAGVAARCVHKKDHGKVFRVTGCDPAGPIIRELQLMNSVLNFTQLIKDVYITKDDAEFVDCTHTSSLSFGKFVPTCKVDTYVGYKGMHQPGCSFGGDLKDSQRAILCSHERCNYYFNESIQFCGLRQSKNTLGNILLNNINRNADTIYGLHMLLTTDGTFWMDVNSESPFGKYDLVCTQ